MVLSQAREIVGAYGGAAALAVAATTGITGAIAAARISGGWLVDRFAVPYVMCAAHALALCGGLLLTLLPAPVTAVLGLGMIGLGYGFVSGATAGGIGVYWRPADYGRIAGRTYIAWCLAAVSLPVLAGYLFDMTQAYGTAVMIAAGANVAGMAMALTMPRHGWREEAERAVPAPVCRDRKRQPDRPDPVLDWGMPELQKPTTDTAIVMLPTENKAA